MAPADGSAAGKGLPQGRPFLCVPAAHPAVAWSTRLVFLMVGIGFAVWAPLVPDAKLRLGMTDGQLGTVLLGLGIGALVALPAAGPLVQKLGPRVVMLGGGAAFCLLLPLLALAPSPLALALLLGIFGASTAAVDIAMNAQAVEVERATGRTLMSGFHGAYSLGAVAGSLAMTGLLAAGLAPAWCAALLGIACAVALLARARTMLPRAHDAEAPRLVLPRGRLALIGALCFVAFLLEGTILDWSGVFIRFVLGLDGARAGLGFAAMSVAMTVGRLTGDAVVARFTPVPVLVAGAALACGGYLLAALAPAVPSLGLPSLGLPSLGLPSLGLPSLGLPGFLLGCALVGLGLANMVPILFSAAGRVPGTPAGVAIAAAATPGYAGLLAGPVGVGWVSQATSLPVAFAGLAVLALVVGVFARIVRQPQDRRSGP